MPSISDAVASKLAGEFKVRRDPDGTLYVPYDSLRIGFETNSVLLSYIKDGEVTWSQVINVTVGGPGSILEIRDLQGRLAFRAI